MYKRAYYIGIIAYVVMLFLSVLFYKERVIFTDSAFYLFYIIKNNDFTVQIFRFGGAICQVPPLIARKAGAPLAAIMQAYSVAFAAYYFICYLICGWLLRRYDFALVILFLNILFVSDTFYWMPSEMTLGIAMLMPVLAYISNKQGAAIKPLSMLLLIAALITVVFCHPLILFVITFCIVFFLLSADKVMSKKSALIIGGAYAAILLMKMLVFRAQYEQHSLSGMKNFVTHFPNYINLYSNKRFLHNCLVKYYWIPILFTGIVLFYVLARERRKLWLFVLSCVGYLALVNISYPDAVTPEFYIENLYTPLAIFIALPFIFDVLPAWGKKNMALPVVALIVISGCVRLYATHASYTTRLGYERKLLTQYDGQKVILDGVAANAGVLQMLWGTPYEFLLLSEVERHKPASILIDENPNKYGWAGNNRKDLIVNWNIFPYTQLPQQYFRFTDTVSSYRVARTTQ